MVRLIRPLGAWALVVLVVLAGAPSAAAQPVAPRPDSSRTLSLNRLLEAVQTRNPALQAVRSRADAVATREAAARALPEPTVGMSVQPLPIVTARGAQRTQWQVQQRIPFPGKRDLRHAAAQHATGVARAEAQAVAADLTLQVTQAYVDLARAQAEIALVGQFRERLRDFEAVATTRYEVGTGTQPAVLKAQIERRRLDLRVQDLRDDAAAARARLADLLDRAPASLAGRAVLDSALTTRAAVPQDTSGLWDQALQQRPEAEARRQARRRAAREVDAARRAFYPDVTVTATYFDIADRRVPPSADGRDALAVGIGVTVPLWRGGLRADLRRAEAERAAARARWVDLQAQVRAQIDALVHRLDTRRRQLHLLDTTLLPQAEAALEATLSAYSAGRTDFLDLLDAERTLFRLRTDRLHRHAELQATAASLDRAVGR